MLTEIGYQRRTYDEILQNKISLAKELFGEDINTEENTPLGKFLRINAYDQSLVEEEAEAIYYSIFPHTASGTSLDRLCVFVGITRNPATSAQFIVTVNGTAGKNVPLGFLVGTETGINFYNASDATINDNGTCEILVVCTETGEVGNVSVDEITQIVNPNVDIASVAGKSIVEKGEEIESDYALRTRFDAAKEGLGSCNESAIIAALMRVPTVTSAGMIKNETDSTDSKGRPPRSFECYVCGGANYQTQIAETIFDKKPIGIKTYGTQSVSVDYGGKESYIVMFSYTTNIPVYVDVTVTTNAEFEGTTGNQQIKENLAEYIDNLGVGKSVVLSSLYGKIHNVTGVQEVTSLKLSKDGKTYSTDNITAEENEICVCYQVKVNGTVV